jgi:hypothetical protein
MILEPPTPGGADQAPGLYRFTNHEPGLGEVQLGAGVWDAHRGRSLQLTYDVMTRAWSRWAMRIQRRREGLIRVTVGDQAITYHLIGRGAFVVSSPAQPDLSAPLWPLGCVDRDPARGLQILAERGHASFHERPRAHCEIHYRLVGPTTQEIVTTVRSGRVASRLVLVPGTAQDADLLDFTLPPLIFPGSVDDWTTGLELSPPQDWSDVHRHLTEVHRRLPPATPVK